MKLALFRPPVRGLRARRAAMLIDLMVSTGIGSLVLAVLCTMSWFTARSFTAMGNYMDLNKASRNALDIMSRDIRQADYLSTATSNQLVFCTDSGTNNLSFTWTPETGLLVRQKVGEPDLVLLRYCDYLLFNTYQRNLSNMSFGAFPNATASTAKLIDLSWRCSRQILQQKVNTESVQTAKIVLRNEHPH